jgi:hypothetical protein
MPRKNSYGEYVFSDNPDFRPNLSPRDIFKLGSFGGTYFRPIKSSITGKNYKNVHLKYPKSWWKGIPEDHFTRPWKDYDKSINKYNVKVGTTLEFWEDKGWITKHNPYGWTDWYCQYFQGKRSSEDERQIDRWKKTAGPNSRFRKWLVNMLVKKKKKYNDYEVSPKIFQTLQHWAVKLTSREYNRIKNE